MRALNTPKAGTVGLALASDHAGISLVTHTGTPVSGVQHMVVEGEHDGLMVATITVLLHKLEAAK